MRFLDSWDTIPFAEGQAKYTLEDLDPYARYELFEGDVPSVFRVHAGDVTVDGPVHVGASSYDDVTMHIIEGDLTIRGGAVFSQADYYGVLYVRGDLRCENAFLDSDARLYVDGTMRVKNLFITGYTSNASKVVLGALEAIHWRRQWERGAIRFVRSGPEPQVIDDLQEHDVIEAVKTGDNAKLAALLR